MRGATFGLRSLCGCPLSGFVVRGPSVRTFGPGCGTFGPVPVPEGPLAGCKRSRAKCLPAYMRERSVLNLARYGPSRGPQRTIGPKTCNCTIFPRSPSTGQNKRLYFEVVLCGLLKFFQYSRREPILAQKKFLLISQIFISAFHAPRRPFFAVFGTFFKCKF